MRDQYWGDSSKEKKPAKSILDSHSERNNAGADDFNAVEMQDNKIFFLFRCNKAKNFKVK